METLQRHHIKAITPTWLLVKKVAPAPPPRDGAKKKPAPAAAYSPLFLSPSAWQKALDEKKSKDAGGAGGGGLPASPRISCMGQVKGRSRKRECSSARGPPAARGSGRGGGGVLATLVLGLFGRQSGRASRRGCSKVGDVPRGSASAAGSSHGGGCAAATAVCVLDPPLPVVRRLARADVDAPSLWERRRGGGNTLEGLRLPYNATKAS